MSLPYHHIGRVYHTIRLGESTIPSDWASLPYHQIGRVYHTIRLGESTIPSDWASLPYHQIGRVYHIIRSGESTTPSDWASLPHHQIGRVYHTIRSGSFFTESEATAEDISHNVSVGAELPGEDTLGVSCQCVQQHSQLLQKVCSTSLMNNPMQLGGQKVIIQIDKLLFQQKYRCGRASDQCVFWMCGTSTAPSISPMELVADRQAATLSLLPIIQQVVKPGFDQP